MTKTLLSILIALVFVFGAAGITVAAAQQSQPGEPLYALRTWSTQMFRQQDTTQVSEQTIPTQPQILEQADHAIQPQSSLHEVEIIQTLQSPALLDDCGQSGTNGQCGPSQHVGADHTKDRPHQDRENDRTQRQNSVSNHDNDSSEHQNSGTNQQNGGSNHENDGSEHGQNDD